MKVSALSLAFSVFLNFACSSEQPEPQGGAGGGAAGAAQAGSSAAAGAGQSTGGGGAPGGGTSGGPPGSGGVSGGAGGVSGGAGGVSGGAGGVSGGAGGVSGGAGGVSGGAGGASGGASGGTGAGNKSAGCGRTEPLNQEPRTYVQHDITVEVAAKYQPAYSTREYHTWLPDGYDPNRAYPLYFWGNGCGVNKGKPEGIPAANIEEVKTGAILVFMIQEDGCFNAGKGGTADTPDVPYFTKMLDGVEAEYCVDKSKVFVGGYSSTAWYAATLSCSHGDRISAIGMAAGGQQDVLPTCTGPAGLILWAGNEGATGNPIETPANVAWKGSAAVRDRLRAANGCAMTTKKWDPDGAGSATLDNKWPSCNLYDNCGKNPVVFCPHGGGHDSGLDSQMSSTGFWQLFKSTW